MVNYFSGDKQQRKHRVYTWPVERDDKAGFGSFVTRTEQTGESTPLNDRLTCLEDIVEATQPEAKQKALALLMKAYAEGIIQ